MTSAFIAGIAAHAFDERTWVPASVSIIVVSAASFAAFFVRRAPTARLAALCGALFVAAVWRFDARVPRDALEAAPPSGESEFRGVLVEEPRHGVQGTFAIVDVPDARVELRVRVPFDAAAGETVEWRCRMRPRPADVRARYRRDVGWSCEPREAPTRVAPAPAANAALHAARSGVRTAIVAAVPEPDASLALGLLIGDDAGIPRRVTQAFRDTGTAHVLAVSGYNVRLLVDALFVLFAVAAVRRRRAAGAVAALVIAFALMTGADPPVVRAAIMGCAGIVASLLGRRDAGIAPLALAAAGMLAAEPFALRHDIGFRLSFAAVAGMRLFGPQLYAAFGGDPDLAGLRRSLADTLAATAATLPIMLHDFGALTPAAPIVNVIIAPFVPPLMMASAAVAAVGTVAPPFAVAPAAVVVALARPFVAVVTSAAVAAPAMPLRVSWPVAALLYAAMGAFVLLPRRRARMAAPPPPDAVVTTYAP